MRFDDAASIIVSSDDAPVTIIESRPFRNGWKCFEAPGVGAVFLDQEQAVDYAKNRACFRSGEIRVVDSTGASEPIIAFSEADRKLLISVLEVPSPPEGRGDLHRHVRRRPAA